MKRLLSIILFFTISAYTQSYQDQWDKVREFEQKRVPKSALSVVENIYNQAKKRGDENQLIKALLHRETYHIEINEDAYAKSIKNIEAELISTKKTKTKLILKSVLAQMYSNYLNKNMYKIRKRANIQDNTSSDIKTWSIEKIKDRAFQLYIESLGDRAKKVEIEECKAILTPSKNTQGLRPTLYDFLAFRALKYLRNSRNYLHKPIYEFQIQDKEAFGSINSFIKYPFETKDKDSYRYKTLIIYQELLKFHQNRKDFKALEYINIERLQFVYDNFTAPNRDSYYIDALRSLESQYTNSNALYYLAEYYYNQGEYEKAITYANRGIKSKDKYIAKISQNIKTNIEAKFLGFNIERVNLPNENILVRVDYTNIKTIFASVVKLDDKEYNIINQLYGEEKSNYISQLKSFNDFNITLPKSSDYKRHSTEVSLGSYPYGRYLFRISKNRNSDRGLLYNISTVSNLSYLHQKSKLLVVDRKTGKALKGVKATFYAHHYNSKTQKDERRVLDSKISDKKGLIKIPKGKDYYSIHLEYNEDSLYFEDNRYSNRRYKKHKNQKKSDLYFFTDRAIYRPGQTIFFKGLAVKSTKNKTPKIITNRKIVVTFYDTNNQKIDSKTFKSNQFGTINGSFIAPKGGLLGSMHLSSTLGGNKNIFVEEYKRPKFEVLLHQIDKEYKLGDTITLKGTAKAYTGNGIESAKIRYTVQRVTSFPWIEWGRAVPRGENKRIALGELKTDKDGNFEINFKALVDKLISPEDKPSFSYEISVDITDTTGETQSNKKTITLGFVSTNVKMIIDKNLDKESKKELKIESTNLDGEFQPIEGELTIERLKPDQKVYRKRYWQEVEKPLYSKKKFEQLFKHYRYSSREKRKRLLIRTIKFDTKKSKIVPLDELEQGEFIITLHTQDKYGTKVQKSKKITVYDKTSLQPPYKTYLWHILDAKSYKVGSKATLLLKSSDANSSVFLSIHRGSKIIKERWLDIRGSTQEEIPIEKKDRGDLYYTLYLIKNNRTYTQKGVIPVPWNKKLKVELVSFRDKLKPNSKERWSLKVSGEDKESLVAEMVATLYDASLDEFVKHQFDLPRLFPKNRVEYRNRWNIPNFRDQEDSGSWMKPIAERDRRFHKLNWFTFDIYGSRGFEEAKNKKYLSATLVAPSTEEVFMNSDQDGMGGDIQAFTKFEEDAKSLKKATTIQVRKNLQETMFFKPQLRTDKDGNIIIDFQTNDMLTRWNFLGFIHTKNLETATIEKEIITQKDLMVVSNLPRFFIEGDKILLSAKVINMSKKELRGECELQLVNPETEQKIYGKHIFSKPFVVPKGGSAVVDFKIKIPNIDITPAIKHTLIAKTDTHTDAEQIIRPILSKRIFVTESKAISIDPKEEKSFTLDSLKNNNSKTLKNHKLTVEFTSNPIWYAIKALPYLMEYPHECNEQTFNRYFANTIASKIINSSPKIKNIFQRWKSKKELKSALSTNSELKSILIEETPWVLDAQNQEEQQKNLAILFDLNRLSKEQGETYRKLLSQQQADGGWAWFQGGRSNWYITQYIAEGFAKLKKIGINNRYEEAIDRDTIRFLDNKMLEQYRSLQKSIDREKTTREEDHLSSILIHYLYVRNQYLYPQTPEVASAYNYYIDQEKRYWREKPLYEQAMIALTLDPTEAMSIVNSLKERALVSDELGMYFKYNNGFYWNQLPIETHTLMMSVFKIVANDQKAVKLLTKWLLKNRQMSHWKTTKATASAIYALLSDNQFISNNRLVDLSFDTAINYHPTLEKAKSTAQEGTGYIKVSFNKFDNKMATIKVKNPNSNIAWGGLYWQYFENFDKINKSKKSPLSINKRLFLVENEVVTPIEKRAINVGDKIKVHIEIKTDRDMEYIMLKDGRASTLEPLNRLSQYRYQDGLGYYESTKDSATYFFIEYLKKGTYIFEYPLFVTHTGEFSNGIATIESIYAPEFKSHSQGEKIYVQ